MTDKIQSDDTFERSKSFGRNEVSSNANSMNSQLYLENRISNQYLKSYRKIRHKTSEADLMEVRSETSKVNKPTKCVTLGTKKLGQAKKSAGWMPWH